MAREDEIRIIAYDMWQREGCLDGYDCDHWFKAEEIWEEQQTKGSASKEGKTKAGQAASQGRRDRPRPRR
jgi:hypothetical protein